MSDLRTAAQQALEALKEARWRIANLVGSEGAQGLDRKALDKIDAAITALKTALAEPEYPLGQATTDVGVPVYVVKKAEPVQESPLVYLQHNIMKTALEQIAGVRPIIDNLLSDKDIAALTLKRIRLQDEHSTGLRPTP